MRTLIFAQVSIGPFRNQKRIRIQAQIQKRVWIQDPDPRSESQIQIPDPHQVGFQKGKTLCCSFKIEGVRTILVTPCHCGVVWGSGSVFGSGLDPGSGSALKLGWIHTTGSRDQIEFPSRDHMPIFSSIGLDLTELWDIM